MSESPRSENDVRAEAVERLKRGDDSQLDVLRGYVRAHIIKIALQVVHSREDAEEILNDVMLKVSLHRHKLDDSWILARAFVLKIARNEALDRARKVRFMTVPFEEQLDTPNPDPIPESSAPARLRAALREILPGVTARLENRHLRILPAVVRCLGPSLDSPNLDMEQVYAAAAEELHLAPPSVRNAVSNVGKALKEELRKAHPESALRDQDVRLALCLLCPLLQA